MKKILRQIKWASLLLVSAAYGQTYTVEKTTSTYSELTGGTELSSDGFDQDDYYVLALPFSFEVYGTAYNSTNVSASIIAFDAPNQEDLLIPFRALVKDNVSSSASISYEVTGTSPDRIVKIQVKDVTLSLDLTGVDYANYQVWLYETSNVIEYHYGSGSVADPLLSFDGDAGVTIGVQHNAFSHVILAGAYDESVSSGALDAYTGIAANGTVYKFTPAEGTGNSYSFTTSTGVYTEITGGTEISTDGFDDEDLFPVTLPFDFYAYGQSYSSAVVGTSGFVFDILNQTDVAIANGGPLADNASNTASISHVTEGASPNRVFKLQFKDLGFYTDNTNNDYVNFQVWLYETTNVIEFHYGSSSVLNVDSYDGEDGPTIGVVHDGNDFYFLSGNASSPVQGLGPVTGTPISGQIFIFTPTFTTGIFSATSTNDIIQLFPNPGNGSFYLNSANLKASANVTIVNALGAAVYSFTGWGGNAKRFDTNLESGVYTVKIESEGKAYFKKLVIE